MYRKKVYIKPIVPLFILEQKYGFFFHPPTDDYWYVMNKETATEKNVEASLRVDRKTKEIRLYITNDHKKLPTLYSNKYNADNYLDFEETLDKFSFADFVGLNQFFKLVRDDLVEYR
jgi:hypothetical protein